MNTITNTWTDDTWEQVKVGGAEAEEERTDRVTLRKHRLVCNSKYKNYKNTYVKTL